MVVFDIGRLRGFSSRGLFLFFSVSALFFIQTSKTLENSIKSTNETKASIIMLCVCELADGRLCQKQFVHATKFAAHVETEHPFAATNANKAVFTSAEKMHIAKQLFEYIAFCRSTLNIFNARRQHGAPHVSPHVLDLLEHNASNAEAAIDELNRFLNLGIDVDGTGFVPSVLIDVMWTAVKRQSKWHDALCMRMLGTKIKCGEGFAPAVLQQKRAKFERQFVHRHNRKPLGIEDLERKTEPNACEALLAKWNTESGPHDNTQTQKEVMTQLATVDEPQTGSCAT